MFSVVSPMYNVGEYLDDYFASLEAQTFGLDRVQIVLVDDGSTDDTLNRAKRFASRHPQNVVVISKQNGGQASARNEGLSHAHGDWVTFPDPDDTLGKTYLADVAALIESDQGASLAMVTARIEMWWEAEDRITDRHALAFRFWQGTRVIDLDEWPDYVQAHVTTGFMRTAVIRDEGIAFDERLRLRFEDGKFVTSYLLGQERRQVGMVASAIYRYRQRKDGSSTIQSSVADSRKYTDTIRYGYLEIAKFSHAHGTDLPRWAQNLILYDIFWILRSSQRKPTRAAVFSPEMHAELRELLPQILSEMDDEAILEFSVMRTSRWMREALCVFKNGSGYGRLEQRAIDHDRGLTRLAYVHGAQPPTERLRINGHVGRPRYDKEYALEYAGLVIAWLRSIWVPTDQDVRVWFDDVEQGIFGWRAERPTPGVVAEAPSSGIIPNTQQEAAELPNAHRIPVPRTPASSSDTTRERVDKRTLRVRKRQRFWKRNANPDGLRKLITYLLQHVPFISRHYRDAWVFLDRDVDANDSAEVLYKWVARNRPEVNAFFVVRRGTDDWRRLRKEGVRVVGYGTIQANLLFLSAIHVASSHADRFVSNPLPKVFGKPQFTFTFLQHGVIKSDISNWLNSKQIDVFVASTQAEYDYLSGPSPYRFGAKEVRLTGLPRFDDLLAQSEAVSAEQRRILLIMPTWRDYLMGDMQSTSADRNKSEAFFDSPYRRNIQGLLASARLRELCDTHGLEPVFMPHPNMRIYLDDFDVPDWITVQSYADVDVRSLIARAQMLITDYSSVAFNFAYLYRPTVYFQFDQEEFYQNHTERPGYFDYREHGFGPVATTVEQAESAVKALLADEAVAFKYRERARETFPVRDGANSKRVFEAMIEARSVHTVAQRSTRAALDSWESLTAAHP